MKNLISERFWCVKHVNIFSDLEEQDIRTLAQIATFKNLKHKERISTEGVYLIKEGRVKVTDNSPDIESEKPKTTAKNTDPDEKQKTKEVLEQGELFGVVQNDDDVLNENVQTYAETLSDVCLGVVTIRDFSFFLKRKPHLGLPLLCLKRAKMPNVLNRVHNTFSYVSKNSENWNSHSYKRASNILIKNKTPDCNFFFPCYFHICQ